jgi:RES domain-containing protein
MTPAQKIFYSPKLGRADLNMPPDGLPPHVPVHEVAYRATSYDVPLWVTHNRRDGRWNFAGTACVQYTCLDAVAPFAEQLRHENLRTEAEARTYRATIWQLQISEGVVVDYSTFQKAEEAGFPPEALVDDDFEYCQQEAARLMSLGAGGVLSPSAALPGSTNLTLFGPRVPIGWSAKVQIATAIPAQPLATGQPPDALTERVRYRGETHSALAEYLGGQGSRNQDSDSPESR